MTSFRHPCRALAALALVVAPVAASAQYFGRNKVNWEAHDFRILKSQKFDVYFYPAESLAAVDGARMVERWYARLSPFLNHTFDRRSFLFFADQADFQQNNVTDIESEGTGGVTEGFRERVLMPFTGVGADDDHVIGHELVHVFQYDISNRATSATPANPGTQGQQPRERTLGLNALPLWLVEGMAEYLSIGRIDANTAMWLRDAARRNDVPTIRQLTTDPRYFPYRYGQALWAYVGGRWGDEVVPRLFRQSLRDGFEPAIRRTLGITAEQLSKDWKESILATYTPQLAGRTPPESLQTRLVVQRGKRGGEYNISPVISPDGRLVAFFSSRALFSIDLFIADAETGRIVRQLGSINTPRHYDALSFISSAGAWSPDGKKLAYVVYREGDQVLEVYDIERRRVDRRIAPAGIGATLDPAWSPDGRYLAFAGLTGGVSDLFIYDFQTNDVRRLTSGRYAELQPSWSPDGRTLAFATDRGEATSLEQLRFGPMRVATMDVATGAITILPTLGGKAITPQYSPDGGSIFVVGDPDGISDVYRLDLAGGTYSRVTRVSSGVSGITALSPALSVARSTGRMVFTVFDRQGYDIVRLDAGQTVGTPVTTAADTTTTRVARAGALPPVPPVSRSVIEQYLADAATGLPPADATYATVPYRAGLKLDYIAPPSVGVSFGGPLGTQLGGGVGASFSDQLGNHNLQAIVALQGELRDAGAQAVYTNTRRRWNYGVGAGHVPYITGFAYYDDSAGFSYNEVYQRIYLDQLSLFTQYPFSTTRRVEFAVSGTRQSYSVDRFRYPLNSFGQPYAQERIREPAPPPLNYAQGMAAFVGDYSFFGVTSPVAGARYRLEVAPTVGDVTFNSALADGRRYFYLRPVTLAARGLFYGRFGRDAEDRTKFYPLFLGEPQLVRGYDLDNFGTGECRAVTTTSDCPVFTRLTGSRIAVASAELRLAFLGPEGFSLIPLNFLPVEIAPFVDAGLAWSSADRVRLRFLRGESASTSLEKTPVMSAGITSRINVLGYLIAEIYYAYPFQRPDKGAHVGFQLAPGW